MCVSFYFFICLFCPSCTVSSHQGRVQGLERPCLVQPPRAGSQHGPALAQGQLRCTGGGAGQTLSSTGEGVDWAAEQGAVLTGLVEAWFSLREGGSKQSANEIRRWQ